MQRPQASYEHCLITGASSGIGAAFARALAPRAGVLTLVARREERLNSIAREIEGGSQARCEVIALDLVEERGVSELLAEMQRRSLPSVHLLVNNAGYGRVGRFEDFPFKDYREMFELNMRVAAELLYRLLGDLQEGPGRGVINVASAAGFQPIPFFAPYAATKAFLRSLSAGVAEELRSSGTRSLSFCPGPVETEFAKVAKLESGFAKPAASAEEVVRVALRAYEKGRLEVVPGLVNRLLAFSTRFAPLRLVLKMSAIVLKREIGGPAGPGSDGS